MMHVFPAIIFHQEYTIKTSLMRCLFQWIDVMVAKTFTQNLKNVLWFNTKLKVSSVGKKQVARIVVTTLITGIIVEK